MFSFRASEWNHAPQSVCLNDVAPENILDMSSKLETSHLEMSLLKDVALKNIRVMSFTLDTSHFEMSPLNDVA